MTQGGQKVVLEREGQGDKVTESVWIKMLEHPPGNCPIGRWEAGRSEDQKRGRAGDHN